MFSKYGRHTILSDNTVKYLASSRYTKHVFKFYANKIIHIAKEPVGSNANIQQLKERFSHLFSWYEQLTGLHEVRLAQNKVIETQEVLSAAQHKRREAQAELDVLRKRIREIQDELASVPKGEEKYLVLTTQEHNLLKEEKQLIAKFVAHEREEREYFHLLTSAVKDSHERERIQANTTKYLSIIGSVVGTLLGMLGSTVNNYVKLKKTKDMILDSVVETNNRTTNSFNQLSSKVDDLFSKYHPTNNVTNVEDEPEMNKDKIQQLNTILKLLKQTNDSLKKTCDKLESYASYLNLDDDDNEAEQQIVAVVVEEEENPSSNLIETTISHSVSMVGKLTAGFNKALLDWNRSASAAAIIDEVSPITTESKMAIEDSSVVVVTNNENSEQKSQQQHETEQGQSDDSSASFSIFGRGRANDVVVNDENVQTSFIDDDKEIVVDPELTQRGETLQKLNGGSSDTDREQFREESSSSIRSSDRENDDDTRIQIKSQYFFTKYLTSFVLPVSFVFFLLKLLLGV